MDLFSPSSTASGTYCGGFLSVEGDPFRGERGEKFPPFFAILGLGFNRVKVMALSPPLGRRVRKSGPPFPYSEKVDFWALFRPSPLLSDDEVIGGFDAFSVAASTPSPLFSSDDASTLPFFSLGKEGLALFPSLRKSESQTRSSPQLHIGSLHGVDLSLYVCATFSSKM